MSSGSIRRLAVPVALSAALCSVVSLILLSSAGAASGGTKVFTFTGGEQAFSVPDGVTSLDVTAVGAEGGAGLGGAPGGFGAVASGKLAVTPGQILFVEVGGNGSLPTGGFNGGASSGAGQRPAGGGGGGTDIRTISKAGVGASLNSRLLTAGGGGGSGGSGFDAQGGIGGQAGLPSLMGNGSDGGHGGYSAADPNAPGGSGGAGGVQVVVPGSPYSYGSGTTGFAANDPYGGSSGGAGGGWVGGTFSFPGAGEGPHGSDPSPHGGGGGGGGGGSSHFASTVSNTSVNTDSTGTPQLTIAYKAGGNASGLKFGKAKLNKKRGTATLPVTVPGTGKLSIGGKGLVHKRPAFARAISPLAKQITEAGTYKLKIKPKGKKKAKLADLGKLKVKAVVTFKPSSGDAVHDTKAIKLRKS